MFRFKAWPFAEVVRKAVWTKGLIGGALMGTSHLPWSFDSWPLLAPAGNITTDPQRGSAVVGGVERSPGQ